MSLLFQWKQLRMFLFSWINFLISLFIQERSVIENLIKHHHLKILSKEQDKIQRPCNCKINKSCPFNGKCPHQCMVYKAKLLTNTIMKNTMESQRQSLNLNTIITCNLSDTISYINVLVLLDVKSKWDWLPSKMEHKIVWISKQMWHKKMWSVSDQKNGYCSRRPKILLNKRTEMISKCRHKNKFILNSVK